MTAIISEVLLNDDAVLWEFAILYCALQPYQITQWFSQNSDRGCHFEGRVMGRTGLRWASKTSWTRKGMMQGNLQEIEIFPVGSNESDSQDVVDNDDDKEDVDG
ncbi:hypothetical protein BsWGS_01712 [Bradybaena similaris]